MRYSLSFLLCLPAYILFAQISGQYVIAPQGGFTQGDDMSISWTLGDLVTETSVLSKSVITQGFQQPDISVRELDEFNPKGENRNDEVSLQASVFPNPFSGDITVTVENHERDYFIDVMDPAGNLLSRNLSCNPNEVLNLNALPAAQYILRITMADEKESKVFQIIKSN